MPKKTTTSSPRLLPPADGATIRMYRTGHGDCFLLAFPGEAKAKPVYVLIDCGYKPGSPAHINTSIKEITDSLRAATGGEIDVAIITHEHQDHVNGITETNFKDIKIRETWLAWTEDPKDKLANRLREIYKDKLLGLVAARNRLNADGDLKRAGELDEFLAFELGGDAEQWNFAAATAHLAAAAGNLAAAGESMNKRSMKIFKDRASGGVRFLRPHAEIHSLPGAPNVRVFPFGPPRDKDDLIDLDPLEQEKFHLMGAARVGFGAACAGNAEPPFASRYRIPMSGACDDAEFGQFFSQRYGAKNKPEVPAPAPRSEEIPLNPAWRRIDQEWLYSAEQLALDLNDYTNNSSLVLAFELKKGGKVLFFAADAQRGNWVSWGKKTWKDGDKVVTARDLLSRAVVYKVGHHGSHNATLNGTASDPNANLGWMAAGDHAREFTAMITAVRSWAETQKGWDHPLKAIKDALLKKAAGRVFQTDTDVEKMPKPDTVSAAEWDAFLKRTKSDRLYFDYEVRG